MAPRRIPSSLKRLRNTCEKNKDTSVYTGERVRLTGIVPPPSDIDKATAAEWVTHMQALATIGVAGPADLLGFRALCEASALSAQAYKAARLAGPTTISDRGNTKPSPEWVVWISVSGTYKRWLSAYGLLPSAQHVAALPAPRTDGNLRVVG
jgi:hypothetical protein